ncbi:hypothetical protein [Sphingomonas sp. BE137]|uniref:Nmad3 family putative nucleotide modification protein n=1 Tax=Sphingomonas sp. BE137 TaxID=2817844 RepID=UPI001AEA3F4C|nr:hypothetical protein [Sphingomonas sp. BE137]
MRIVLSRKGFDTGSGGAPSPIKAGRPVSLPIPTTRRSDTTYEMLGLGELVEKSTRGKISRHHLCHEDPMFVDGQCIFGQCGAAQSHLSNQGVGVGDIFLFFGLFADEATGERHHRIFGYLRVEEAAAPSSLAALDLLARPHPHTIGEWNANNTVYRGEGGVARIAHSALRLTQPGGPLRQWIVPKWLSEAGLSFHRKPERWLVADRLEIVARGQEFVTDVSDNRLALDWTNEIIGLIRS